MASPDGNFKVPQYFKNINIYQNKLPTGGTNNSRKIGGNDNKDLLNQILQLLNEGNIDEAKNLCLSQEPPIKLYLTNREISGQYTARLSIGGYEYSVIYIPNNTEGLDIWDNPQELMDLIEETLNEVGYGFWNKQENTFHYFINVFNEMVTWFDDFLTIILSEIEKLKNRS